jgi:hypothetical protein
VFQHVNLGPLSQRVLGGARSAGKGEYPAFQEWADELERLLAFAVTQAQFARFETRLSRGRAHERDEALQELRTAFFLSHNGFPILKWEPPGLPPTFGEYTLGAEGQNVFVEVKSPGWEAELSADEIKAGRAKRPKWVDGDGRAVAPWLQARQCVARAYRKFTDTQPNLLVIADDFHVPLTNESDQLAIALFERNTVFNGEPGYFTGSAYERLGGVAVFSATLARSDVEYAFRLFENPCAVDRTRIPSSLIRLGSALAAECESS